MKNGHERWHENASVELAAKLLKGVQGKVKISK